MKVQNFFPSPPNLAGYFEALCSNIAQPFAASLDLILHFSCICSMTTTTTAIDAKTVVKVMTERRATFSCDGDRILRLATIALEGDGGEWQGKMPFRPAALWTSSEMTY